jgi:hypothetical protein
MTSKGMGCTVTEFTGEEFVPRILSLAESSCIVVDSSGEVCVNCINIRHPSESYFLTTPIPASLPQGVYGCTKTSCAKRNVEDSSEDSHSWGSYFSRKSMNSPASSQPSKSSSKSLSSDSSRSDSDSSDSTSDWLNLDSYDLVIFVGDDIQKQMFVDAPPTSTTQSTSNRNLVGVIITGLGLLVLGVALFSYWMKRNRTDEHSHLLTHDSYHSYY